MADRRRRRPAAAAPHDARRCSARRTVAGSAARPRPPAPRLPPGARARRRRHAAPDEIRRIAPASFTWKDGERTIHFGRDALDHVLPALAEGYTLLTTPRASAMAPAVAERAGAVHEVAPGRVDELAGALLDDRRPRRADRRARRRARDRHGQGAGGGACARRARPRVAAIPTTLSAAEMTAVHRRAAGADSSLPRRAPRDRRQRPGAQRLAAAGRARRERRERARPRRRGPGDAAREPGARARRPRGRAADRRRYAGGGRTTASPTATRSRSPRCCRATRSTARATACTTSCRRRSRASRASATARPTR